MRARYVWRGARHGADAIAPGPATPRAPAPLASNARSRASPAAPCALLGRGGPSVAGYGSILAACGLLLAACGAPPDAARMLYEVTAEIAVGEAPHGIRVSADGDTAYVALSGEGRIAVVDLTTNAVVEKWEAGTNPLDLIATADGWLVSQFRDSVLIRLDSLGVIVPEGDVQVGAGPSLFTPDPVRGRAWITLEFADRAFEVDLGTSAAVAFHATGDRPYPGDAIGDGSRLFVPNLEDGTVSVIDVLSGELDATVEVCPGPPGGALTPDQATYVVACGGSDEVAFIDTASFEVRGRVSEGLGPRPFSATVESGGEYALVINAGGTTVSVVDLAAGAVVQRLEVGEQPIVVRRHPDGRRILVANEVSGTLVVIEPVVIPEAPSAGGGPPRGNEAARLGSRDTPETGG